MNVALKFWLERIEEDVLVTCSGRVEKHFGLLGVRDFKCETPLLTEDERDICEQKLIDRAFNEAGWLGIAECEPDARRYAHT